MEKNGGKSKKDTLFAGLSFYLYDSCSEKEELQQRQKFIKTIEDRGGKCFILYSAYCRSKYTIALCDPYCRTFVKSEAMDFVTKEKRDLFSIQFVYDSISSGELKILNDYKLEFKQVCSRYDAMHVLQNSKSYREVQKMHNTECAYAADECRGFITFGSEEEDSDNFSLMSSYSESMSSLSEDDYVSYVEDPRRAQLVEDGEFFKQQYSYQSLFSLGTSKPKPEKLFKGITFYIHPPEKKNKQLEFSEVITSNGGRIATETDLATNIPIVCLTLCKDSSDERISEFVSEDHRDLFHYSFVTESITFGELKDLKDYSTTPKYCTNYNANILVDTKQKTKFFSFICKKHSRKCTTKTCQGKGKKCGYYRKKFYTKTRKPKSKYPSKIHRNDYSKVVSAPEKKVDVFKKKRLAYPTMKSYMGGNRYDLPLIRQDKDSRKYRLQENPHLNQIKNREDLKREKQLQLSKKYLAEKTAEAEKLKNHEPNIAVEAPAPLMPYKQKNLDEEQQGPSSRMLKHKPAETFTHRSNNYNQYPGRNDYVKKVSAHEKKDGIAKKKRYCADEYASLPGSALKDAINKSGRCDLSKLVLNKDAWIYTIEENPHSNEKWRKYYERENEEAANKKTAGKPKLSVQKSAVVEETRQPSTSSSSFSKTDNASKRVYGGTSAALQTAESKIKQEWGVSDEVFEDCTKFWAEETAKGEAKREKPQQPQAPVPQMVFKYAHCDDEQQGPSCRMLKPKPAETFTHRNNLYSNDAAHSLGAKQPRQIAETNNKKKKIIDFLEVILETMMEKKKDRELLGSVSDFKDICEKVKKDLNLDEKYLKYKSVKTMFYQELFPKLENFETRIKKIKDGEACYTWLENWAKIIKG